MRKTSILWISVISLVVVCAIGALVALALLSGDSQEDKPPIPGWQKFEAGGIELWLPDSWEGGDPSEVGEMIVEHLRSLGPDFEQYAQTIEENPSMSVLWAFDYEVGESGYLTAVSVVKHRVLSSVPMDTLLDQLLEQLPAPVEVIERGTATLSEREAGRYVTEWEYPGVTAKQVVYIIKEGSTMWGIAFSTAAEEFDQRLALFEQSARTFAIQPPEECSESCGCPASRGYTTWQPLLMSEHT
jgi:hypothetical protein